MTEALRIAPGTPDGITPITSAPRIFELPFHLRRRTLKAIRREEGSVPEKLWNDRGEAVEARVQSIIISQTEIVKKAVMNPATDTEGPDLKIELVDGMIVFGEIKSSTVGLGEYKNQIIEDIEESNGGQLIGPWARDLAREQWLVNHNIVIINGGEKDRRERTEGEILNDSFYPQLERIRIETQVLKEELEGLIREYHHSKRLQSLEKKPIQLFPEAA
ncbi:MAG: hypothetical protein AAB702_02670 [Patescibacteria group bacterium]